MPNKKHAYRRKKNSEQATISLGAQAALPTSIELSFKQTRKLAFRRHYDPSSIIELLSLDDFSILLGQSLVFIQNTRKSSDYLLETLIKECSAYFTFRLFQTHHTGLSELLTKIVDKIQKSERCEIWIIDSTNPADNLGEFCRKVSLLKSRRWGVWIRGYIQDFHPRDLSFFEALFAFRLSSDEYEILKSVIPITDKIINQMEESLEENYDKRKVLTFLNYPRTSQAPLIKINPKVLFPPSIERNSNSSNLTQLVNFGFMEILQKKETTMNQIKTGHNINIGGNQSVANITQMIDSTLGGTEQSQLAEALKVLTHEVSTNPKISETQKGEHLEIISHLTSEAAKPQPNKTMLKSLIEGLGGVLKGVVGTARVINAIDVLQEWTENIS